MDFLNKILSRTLSTISLLVLLTACYTDFEPNLHQKSVLCMNSMMESGKPINVMLTHTWRYSDGTWENGKSTIVVKDAVISLYVDDVLTEEVSFEDEDESKAYYGYDFEYKPKPGDRIRLIADSKEYGIAEASVVVPNQVKIEKIEHHVSNLEIYTSSLSFNDSFNITFTDTPDETNYYRLIVTPQASTPIFGGHYNEYVAYFGYFNINYGYDPIFTEHIGAFDYALGSQVGGFSLFTDCQIQGKPYTINLKVENGHITVNDPNGDGSSNPDKNNYGVCLRFSLYNVTESYYNWYLYDWQASESIVGNLAQIGTADLYIPYSNVSTNAGIVAASTSSEAEINYDYLIKEYFPDAQ